MPANGESVADPAAIGMLLERAIEANPANAALRLKLANLHLDGYRHAAAAAELEAALHLDPGLAETRSVLGRCYNALERARDTLAVLEPLPGPEFERARALLIIGRTAEAEAELRAVLADNPHSGRACRQLCKLLRRAGRIAELVETCEGLARAGVRHARLLYDWGTALALAGQHERARAVMFDRGRIKERLLPLPDGFASHADFNAALAEELLDNRYGISEFPAEDQAPRGSTRVHALFAGRRPDLIRALMARLQGVVDSILADRSGPFDPWIDATPRSAQIRAWGLIQRGNDYEEWHLHPEAWLSGVYYIRVPRGVSAEGEGPGCIEFGPPHAVQRALPGYLPNWRHRPQEGHLLLAPSHYAHRTIPSGLDEHRISLAFDVVPQRDASGQRQITDEERVSEPL